MTFEIKQYGNIVIASTEDQVWKSWMAEDFSERKMNNFIKKIQNLKSSYKERKDRRSPEAPAQTRRTTTCSQLKP